MTSYLIAASVGVGIATAILYFSGEPWEMAALFSVLVALWAIAQAIQETRQEAQP